MYNNNNNELLEEEYNLIGVSNDSADMQCMSRTLDVQTNDIVRQIIDADKLESVQDLTHLFNVAQVKKQVIRNLTYNQLLDKITNQMGERLEKRADQFSNKDLLDYAKVVQDGIDKAQKQISTIDTSPAIQVNTQNNITIQTTEELDRDSKKRVMDAAKAAMEFIMKQQQGIVDTLSTEQSIINKNNLDNINCDDGNIVYNSDTDEFDDEDKPVDDDSLEESFNIQI